MDNLVDESDASYLYQMRGVYYFSKQVTVSHLNATARQ